MIESLNVWKSFITMVAICLKILTTIIAMHSQKTKAAILSFSKGLKRKIEKN